MQKVWYGPVINVRSQARRLIGLAMLKRLSSLALVLLLGGSMFAGAVQVRDENVCAMTRTEMMPHMGAMPCCHEERVWPVVIESKSLEQCCVAVPREPGPKVTAFNLRPFSIVVLHPAALQSPAAASAYKCSYSFPLFLPNHQSSYIRNLSLLI